jgi:hypothetical protein
VKTYRSILFEKLKLKKVHAGSYEANIGNINVRVYKAEMGGYWSSTVEVGNYGDADWEEEVFQDRSKAEVIKSIETFIKRLK